ncbi:MAG TPA: glyoxalase/bleomycin resistance/extradiol dioxygenase family protein [Alphaproteobacteria bacterium]|nr:glyoxalase/bleomycin resistance/extradiol dioxygenase family protein [Alphaproteobacteria bacterium]HAJ45433.1 glyoxalase/bleomycin resistance/extradiol dioxygenase family protein [Alphaproteobacteria bacterium]
MRLNQVTVSVEDYDRAVAFYTLLGLRQIVASPPHYARFELPDGEATFSIEVVPNVPHSGQPLIYFEVHNLDEAYAALTANGIVFERGPADQPWAWREAHFKDPFGNRLCLYHAGQNRRYPPWRIETKG